MRRPNIIRPVKLTTTFPEDVHAKLHLHLYSKVEGRVPKGAIQAFLIERIREYFDSDRVCVTSQEADIVGWLIASAIANLPQEEWVGSWSDPQSVYIKARELLDRFDEFKRKGYKNG